MEIALLVTALLLGGIVYYVYNRKLKTQKGRSSATGITQWLRGLSTGAQQSGSPSSAQPQSTVQGTSVRTATEVQEQIAVLLDDVYEDFLSETKEMRKQFANDLEQVQNHMSNRLEDVERKLEELRAERSMAALTRTDRGELSTATEAEETEPNSQDFRETFEGTVKDGGFENGGASFHADSTSYDAPQTAFKTESTDQDDKSFLILEELYRGKSVAEVASSLEVGVQEVELVRQLLQSPPSK